MCPCNSRSQCNVEEGPTAGKSDNRVIRDLIFQSFQYLLRNAVYERLEDSLEGAHQIGF